MTTIKAEFDEYKQRSELYFYVDNLAIVGRNESVLVLIFEEDELLG
jgi:hypothetical protein